jgi:glycyl-tRNA synthetase
MFFLERMLIKGGISSKVDDSGQSVGKRYARTDECGIPFALTVDFDTVNDDTVTMRDLYSMKQIRLPIADLVECMNSLNLERITWQDVVDKYGLFTNQAAE